MRMASLLSNIASFSGIIAIPFAFVGVFTGNKIIATARLCWLVSHFIGYITRMLQEEHKEAIMRLGIAEATFSAKRFPQEGPLPRRVSMN